jgi:hypothetical protein
MTNPFANLPPFARESKDTVLVSFDADQLDSSSRELTTEEQASRDRHRHEGLPWISDTGFHPPTDPTTPSEGLS